MTSKLITRVRSDYLVSTSPFFSSLFFPFILHPLSLSPSCFINILLIIMQSILYSVRVTSFTKLRDFDQGIYTRKSLSFISPSLPPLPFSLLPLLSFPPLPSPPLLSPLLPLLSSPLLPSPPLPSPPLLLIEYQHSKSMQSWKNSPKIPTALTR